MLRLFASLWNSTVSPRKPVRKSPRRNRLRLEGLEPRLMFASDLYADDLGTVATSGSGSAQMASSSSTGTLQALTQSVNTFDIDLAIEAGLSHLQNILDANNHGIPFFFVWAMTRSQTQSYGDSYSGRDPAAHMAFERHLTSNAAGRATYALLMGAEAIGAELNPHVMDTLKEWVLTSLHKPRNGNWNDHSPGNQMVTGLASDPRYYGSEDFNLTHLFNMGAGMRGALGLATLADDANEIQPGYLWSSRTVFEVAVHNIRQFYVYGGGQIGGERAYNWETFRHQLGLEGGDGWTGNINTEIKRDWSNIWTSWSNPFLIRELVKFHEATGHQASLDLATELRDHAFYQAFPLSVSQARVNNFTHMFEVTAEMNAYSRLALALGDADMMDRVRARYEALRGVGFSTTGWVPEWLNRGSDVGEINNTAELIETALTFAEWGWTDYYQDVERFTRGHVLPSQLLDTSFVVSNSIPANDGQRRIAQRVYGAFGFPAPYGHVATRNPSQTGGYHVDVTAGAVATLAVIKDAIHRLHHGVHEINLLFDLDNSQITITSPYPEGDRLSITTKVAGDVRLRLPNWADRAAVTASLSQQGLQFELSSDQVLIRQPQVGTAFYVAMPLATQRTTDVVNGRSITIDWRGDSVIAMSRMNTPLPFFATPSSSPPPQSPPPPPLPEPGTETNTPPVVSAGPDRTVMLGATVSLIGAATDDGLPESPGTLSIGWSKLTGPGTVLFSDTGALNTTVELSAPGQYVLRLSASDGQFSRSDDVTITVVDPVQPVTVAFQDGVFPTIEYAGTRDTTINSSAPVSSHGAENKLIVDGHPDLAALMAWDVSTIPIGSILISASIELFVTNTSKHSYELYALQQAWEELAATWQQFAPGQSWASHGASGAADSGTEILGQIALPKHGFRQIGLNQAGLELIQAWIDDPNGNHGVILKDYVSADDDAHFSSRETPTANQRPKLIVTYRPGQEGGGSGPGEKEPEEPPPSVNQPPQVNAGPDQTIQLPASVSLAGIVTDDGLPASPGRLGTAWSAVSGPGSVTFGDAGNRNTTASFSAAGTYVLRLAANDGQHQSFDELTVTVLPATLNEPPQVNAGADQTIQFPATASLAGTVNDDGLPAAPGNVSSNWSHVSGPGTVTFGNASAPNTSASFSAPGTYVLRLSASDGEHQTFDELTVTVLSAVVNQAPQVNAGVDQTIQLPATASLVGTVTDDGLPASPGNVISTWSKVSGPGTVTFFNASARNTSASLSAAGTYVLRLSANDGQYQSFDELTVTVIPPLVHHQPPLVSAGPDIEIIFGKSLTLPGTVSITSPARPITAIWTLTLGPGPAHYSNPNSLVTDVYFERTGTYLLRLTVSDGQFTVYDEVKVTAVPKSTKRR